MAQPYDQNATADRSYYSANNGTSYNASFVRTQFGEERLFYSIYGYVLVDVLMAGVPLVILTLLTIRLIKAMKDHRHMQLQTKSHRSRLDSNATFALILVVIVFIICHVPMLVMQLMIHVGWNLSVVFCLLGPITEMLCLLNSAVNFFIYILSNQSFRAVLTENLFWRRAHSRVVSVRPMDNPGEVEGDPIDDSVTRL